MIGRGVFGSQCRQRSVFVVGVSCFGNDLQANV